MDSINRREVLEHLAEQLKQIEPSDERGQALIANALSDIRRALDPEDASLDIEDETLVEQLQDTVYHFEGTHPDVTSAITVFIDSLSNMGL